MRDRAEIPADWWCAASPRPAEVPEHCVERRSAAARGARTLEEKRGLVATLDLEPQNPTQMLKSGHYHKTRGQQSGCSALDATVI